MKTALWMCVALLLLTLVPAALHAGSVAQEFTVEIDENPGRSFDPYDPYDPPLPGNNGDPDDLIDGHRVTDDPEGYEEKENTVPPFLYSGGHYWEAVRLLMWQMWILPF